ncbi:MAG: hypothetical protein AAFV80_07775 [Bacteroidota bacterium]
MSDINWNDGRLISLVKGDVATCQGYLKSEVLYGIFFYNASGNEQDTTITVQLSDTPKPIECVVPGTIHKKGLTAICFVDGTRTSSLSVHVVDGEEHAQIEAIICSVKIPRSMRQDLSTNKQPINRNSYNFDTLAKYFQSHSSKWYALACTAI